MAGPNGRKTALVLGGLVVLLSAALVALSVLTRHNPLTAAGDVVAIAVPFAAVGVFLARRRPGNAIGRLMISTAVFALLSSDSGFYAVFDYRMGHRLPFGPAAVLAYQAWLPTIASVPLALEPVHASVWVKQL